MEQKHILGILVENRPGVLARVSGMFARRKFNIDTITVGKTTTPEISKMIITLTADNSTLEQVEKQLNKIIDVIKVSELMPDESIIAETCLIKVAIRDKKSKDELIKYAEIYKVKIMDITQKSLIFRIIGKPEKIESFIELIKNHGIKEISRSGITAIVRGTDIFEQ